jgi:hypothetical protein
MVVCNYQNLEHFCIMSVCLNDFKINQSTMPNNIKKFYITIYDKLGTPIQSAKFIVILSPDKTG